MVTSDESSLLGIKTLESESAVLEPNSQERYRLLQAAIAYVEELLADCGNLPAYTAPMEGPSVPSPSESGVALERILALLRESVDRVGVQQKSGGHLGYLAGGGLFSSAIAGFLAESSNRFSGRFASAPGAVRIENEVTRWLAEIVGYPDTATGNLTSGGSAANLNAIVTAREAMLGEDEVLSEAVIYKTDQSHHCIARALKIAGLVRCPQRSVPVDNLLRMDPQALEKQLVEDRAAGLRPWLIIGTAGTTNSGAIDPLGDLSKLSHEYDCWLHVDAAYGGCFMLCEEIRDRLAGLEEADSIVLDPHKGLFLPYGIGALLVRDGELLEQAFGFEASYLDEPPRSCSKERSPCDLSFELSRPFRGLRVWFPLLLHGLRPVRAALSEKLMLARWLYDELASVDGVELYSQPELTTVLFRLHGSSATQEQTNRELLRSIHLDGRVFPSSTRIHGEFWLRTAILSHHTHLEHVRVLCDSVRNAVRK